MLASHLELLKLATTPWWSKYLSSLMEFVILQLFVKETSSVILCLVPLVLMIWSIEVGRGIKTYHEMGWSMVDSVNSASLSAWQHEVVVQLLREFFYYYIKITSNTCSCSKSSLYGFYFWFIIKTWSPFIPVVNVPILNYSLQLGWQDPFTCRFWQNMFLFLWLVL